jgi:hypothetical protein
MPPTVSRARTGDHYPPKQSRFRLPGYAIGTATARH